VSVQLTRIFGDTGDYELWELLLTLFLALACGCGLGCLGFWCIQRRRRNRKDYQLGKLDGTRSRTSGLSVNASFCYIQL
jgi:hypothetical protein